MSNKRKQYFRTQKRWGLSILIFGSIIGLTLEPLIGFLFGMMGFYLIVTKDMVLMNDYFFEVQEEEESE